MLIRENVVKGGKDNGRLMSLKKSFIMFGNEKRSFNIVNAGHFNMQIKMKE